MEQKLMRTYYEGKGTTFAKRIMLEAIVTELEGKGAPPDDSSMH